MELHAWTVDGSGETAKLSATGAADFIREIATASVRPRPIEAHTIFDTLATIEAQQFGSLKRPSEAERAARFTFTLIPFFAGVISSWVAVCFPSGVCSGLGR